MRNRNHTLLLTLGVVLLASSGCTNKVESVGSFARVAPESLGYSHEKLSRIGRFCQEAESAALLIIHDGQCVYAWGDVHAKYPLHSIRKPLLSGLYGIYTDRGMIDTNLSLADLRIDDVAPQLTPHEKTATIADLLASRSGVYHPAAAESQAMMEARPERGRHTPGTHFYYNNWDFNALGTIFREQTGENEFEAFHRELAIPLGMRDFSPEDGFYWPDPDRSVHPAYHIRMTAHDLALYGMLYLRNGSWNGQQIISEDWIRTSTAFRSIWLEDLGLGYGWMWQVLSEDAGLGRAFMHTGAGTHMLLVLQDMNLVVVHRVDSEKMDSDISFTQADLYTLFYLVADAIAYPVLTQRLRIHDDRYPARDDLSGLRVAIYFGDGMDRQSALAMGRAFQWMGCKVGVLTADEIKTGSLDHFDVLACPGGESNPNPWAELGSEGKTKIQDFIRGGGGYVGIGLGAMYACNDVDYWNSQARLGPHELYLDLFPGLAFCGQESIAPQGTQPLMTPLQLGERAHPISRSQEKHMQIVYIPSSPYFQSIDRADVDVVATYETTGHPAMVAFEYGKGRVFLSGPHPEIEVDSDRDGSSAFDGLADEGSEWPLLLEATRWIAAR